MVVVVLGFLGLIVGIAATTFGPGNYVMGWQFVLPAHSDGIRLVCRGDAVQTGAICLLAGCRPRSDSSCRLACPTSDAHGIEDEGVHLGLIVRLGESP
jgi:hypothetical protein